ncbi:MAG: phosphatase PAP2 family protein [Thermomicrobiales bacterium]
MADVARRQWAGTQPGGRGNGAPASTRTGVGRGLRELATVLGVTLAYFFSRGLARGGVADATAHAHSILNLETALHLAPEHALQVLALQHGWLLTLVNNFYLYAHLPVLIGVALWLYWLHPQAYTWLRNAFVVSALLGLAIYIWLPVAPPRFMPGFTDTMALYGFNVDGSAAGAFYNPYAAMPSLHVGWSLLAGIAIIVCARSWWGKALGLALPVLMMLTVMMTGNHYLLDVVAGAAVATISLAGAGLWREKGESREGVSREIAGMTLRQ